MDPHLAHSLLDPAVQFFALGLIAGALRSNLEVPPAATKFLSLYLLMAIGFKGGVALRSSGLTADAGWALSAAMLMAVVIPIWVFALLRRWLNAFDAAAVAATYGSVSAVTFIAANHYLESQGVTSGGYMAVALVLMESPAVIMALLLANRVRREVGAGNHTEQPRANSTLGVLAHAFTEGAPLLLLGSLAVGFLSDEAGVAAMQPFTQAGFKGALALFLLDMGLTVAARARELRHQGALLIAFGLLAPPLNAALAGVLAVLFGLALGDAVLLCVLAASASYIVAPAVLRHALPEANAGLYFGLALAVTFPFNIVIGIPLYFRALSAWI